MRNPMARNIDLMVAEALLGLRNDGLPSIRSPEICGNEIESSENKVIFHIAGINAARIIRRSIDQFSWAREAKKLKPLSLSHRHTQIYRKLFNSWRRFAETCCDADDTSIEQFSHEASSNLRRCTHDLVLFSLYAVDVIPFIFDIFSKEEISSESGRKNVCEYVYAFFVVAIPKQIGEQDRSLVCYLTDKVVTAIISMMAIMNDE
jgi:hypothetical protein